jgi:hypothetical protein
VLGKGVGAGVVYGLSALVWLSLAGVLVIPVLAFVDAGDLAGTWDRLSAMRSAQWSTNANPVFDLIDGLWPGASQQAPDLVGGALPVLATVATALIVAVSALVVILSLTLTVLLVEAVAIGADGAACMWRAPIMTSNLPIGDSRVTLVPATTLNTGGLTHSRLTDSPEGVAAVVDAVARLLGEPSGPP